MLDRPRLLIASVLAAASIAIGDDARAADQYRRWLDNGKVFTCATVSGGVEAQLNNQDVEFLNLLPSAQFTINYVHNGSVVTTSGPFVVEQTSGTRAYGAFAESFPSYPFTFEFRLDTIVDGALVYRSSLFVTCAADGAVAVTPVHVDFAPGLRYRRWLDNGKVFTCATVSGGVEARLNNQDVEFLSLPADAQFTINYIDNGVTATDGPFTVEQSNGTRAYGAFAESFPSYPFTFQFRLDTLIAGKVVYQSTIGVNCTADAVVPVTPVNVKVAPPPPLPVPLLPPASLAGLGALCAALGLARLRRRR